MKTYYELLSVEPSAPADEIKHAFRREIARYHPDKVQHLGPEFQEIAATRATELTEAYRVLMDAEARRQYDASLADGDGGDAPAQGEPRPGPSATTAPPPRAPSEEPARTPVPESVRQARATISEFLKRATLARLRAAVEATAGTAAPLAIVGVDAAFAIKPKGGLFKRSEPPIRLLARVVSQVDAVAVTEAWPLSLKAADKDAIVCLLLLGSAIASPAELSTAVTELRRKSRNAGPVLVPVDVRDWGALFPPDTPALVRSVIQKLKQEK